MANEFKVKNGLIVSGATSIGKDGPATSTLDIYGDVYITGSIYVSASLFATASNALTASYAFNATSASYATTASFALGYATNQTYATASYSNVATWSFNHKLGAQYVTFQVYDSTNTSIIPYAITAVDKDNANIYFTEPVTGVVVASIGNGYTVNSINTGSLIVSSQTSSMSVLSASYAVTASYALNSTAASGGETIHPFLFIGF